MRRRLALLMATVLCVTSVPQVSLIGIAAEETAPETELVGSTEDAMGIELQSAENLEETAEIQSAETEVAAVQETLAAETETAVAENKNLFIHSFSHPSRYSRKQPTLPKPQ